MTRMTERIKFRDAFFGRYRSHVYGSSQYFDPPTRPLIYNPSFLCSLSLFCMSPFFDRLVVLFIFFASLKSRKIVDEQSVCVCLGKIRIFT